MTDRTVICASCEIEFITEIKPSYCCDGSECGCYGKDQNRYVCEQCNDVHDRVKEALSDNFRL